MTYEVDTLFLQAIDNQVDLSIIRFLLESGVSSNAINDAFISMFGDTIEDDQFELIQLLVDYGANIHIEDNLAFYESICQNHLELLRYLLVKGVKIHYGDEDELLTAIFWGSDEAIDLIISSDIRYYFNNIHKFTLYESDRKKIENQYINRQKSIDIILIGSQQKDTYLYTHFYNNELSHFEPLFNLVLSYV
jgi:hypothetical protein